MMLGFGMAGCVSEPPENLNKSSGASDNQTGDAESIKLTEPHVPVIETPRMIIAENTWEHEGKIMSGGKVFIPMEFDNDPQLQEIKESLPVITFYPFDMTTLQGDGWNLDYFERINTPFHGVVFYDTPETVLYTLYDEDFEAAGITEMFEFPVEPGDYILRIDALDTAFFARIVVGEPRGWCERIDRYHGGGEGLRVNDYDTLLEIHALLEKDDRAVADYFKAICDREDGRRWECPCFIQTIADLQSFFSWIRLDQIRLPFSQTASFDSMVLRDRYADFSVSYVIDDMLFNFYFYPGMIDNTGENYEDTRGDGIVFWSYERVATVDDVNIYIYRIHDNFENPDFPGLPENPQVSFILSVSGSHVGASIYIKCKNPETCENGHDFGSGHTCNGEWVDRQAAIDGILQFEFNTLFNS